MAAGVGIDLLEIDRLERALERHPRLAARVFTEAERDYAAARARPARHLAARFAAKEAVVKALGLSATASACARSRSSPASRRAFDSRAGPPMPLPAGTSRSRSRTPGTSPRRWP